MSNIYFLLKIWTSWSDFMRYSRYTNMRFFISFRPEKRGQKWCDNDFKIFWANYCSSTITDSAKQKRKEIFEARTFSDPLRFFHCYLIYFYSYWTFPLPHVHLGISILAHLKRLFKNVSPWAFFWGFAIR